MRSFILIVLRRIYTLPHLSWSLEITLLLTLYILVAFISSCSECSLPASRQKCQTLLNSHYRLFYWMCPIQICKRCAEFLLLSLFLFPRGKQNICWKIHFCNCKEHRSLHHDITTYREKAKYGGITVRRPYTSDWNNTDMVAKLTLPRLHILTCFHYASPCYYDRQRRSNGDYVDTLKADLWLNNALKIEISVSNQ